MKRVILATMSSPTDTYHKVSSKQVTLEYIRYDSRFKTLSDKVIRSICSGILAWKSDNDILYHHDDTDTGNNISTNIILIDAFAHGYLHNYTTQLILRHKFECIRPGYSVGKLAHDIDIKVFKRISDALDFSKYSATQILDAIAVSPAMSYISTLDEYDKASLVTIRDMVENVLNSANIEYVKRSLISNLVEGYKSSLNHPDELDVTYVDDNTGYQAVLALGELFNETSSAIAKKSLEAIKSFIRDNSQSEEMIQQTWERITKSSTRKSQ